MEFKEKQYDGPYEVSGIDIYNNGELFKGVLYYPPESYKKPYPLIIYFHGFPQLFSLQEIVKTYSFLLNMGLAFIVFDFRGYRFSEGKISIKSQVSDAMKIIEFAEIMAKKNVFALNNINIMAHDFGAYIALILSSKIKRINRLLLVSPILDLKKHVNGQDFLKVLNYINRFLPGNIRGMENVDEFIKMTKKELSKKEFQIENIMRKLKNKKLKIIIGEVDKVTPLEEVKNIIHLTNRNVELSIIKSMDHECIDDKEIEKRNEGIKKYFIKK